MNSLKVGKEIYSHLKENKSLTDIVGNKIYPIIVEKDTNYPFIVYKRSNVIPDYTKDYHFKDDVIVDIICVSNHYVESVEIATLVRESLEDKKYGDIVSIRLESADEDFVDDAYIQTLTFNLTINK